MICLCQFLIRQLISPLWSSLAWSQRPATFGCGLAASLRQGVRGRGLWDRWVGESQRWWPAIFVTICALRRGRADCAHARIGRACRWTRWWVEPGFRFDDLPLQGPGAALLPRPNMRHIAGAGLCCRRWGRGGCVARRRRPVAPRAGRVLGVFPVAPSGSAHVSFQDAQVRA